ncbi:MAG: molybdenum cofactor biosynthesis protein MoaE [Verrucomicrobia bacterium]|nr:molybdenum cofactor biosynthesis protein MoaE [Verrucomicrobiota bacterium]
MLQLTNSPIDPAALRQQLVDTSSGALVTFEGTVRDINNRRDVTSLEYEAAEPELAENEFAAIAEEVRRRFQIIDLRCAHRTGTLKVGDLAVWIGVIAEHRADAFDACRYIIDELKHRLPIWKKEHYADGTSKWLMVDG